MVPYKENQTVIIILKIIKILTLKKNARQMISSWGWMEQMEATGFNMHLEAVGTVAILCRCCVGAC